MNQATYACLLLGLSACTFNLDVNTVNNGPVLGAGDAKVDAAPEHEQDASMVPLRHPACQTTLPTPLPAPPAVRSDATGRPAFDLWRALDCRSLTDYPQCSPTNMVGTASWRCDACLLGDSDAGVCSSADGACELLTTRDGECQACAPVAAKRRACCLGLPGFDCREWPYVSDSQRGEACARHEDCEPGLMCKQAEGELIARCACPEETLFKLEGAGCNLPRGSEGT
ncbi:MAG: hypothetical protein QM778_27725 [Myxococcales bacterium]